MKKLIDFFRNKNNHCLLFEIYFSLLSFFTLNNFLVLYLHDNLWLKDFIEFDYITYLLYFLCIFWIIIFWKIIWKLIYNKFFKDTKEYDISFLILTLWTWIIFVINVLIILISLFFSSWTDVTFWYIFHSISYLLWWFNIFSIPFCIILFSSFVFLFKKWQNHRAITIVLLIFYAIIAQVLIWIPIFLYYLK